MTEPIVFKRNEKILVGFALLVALICFMFTVSRVYGYNGSVNVSGTVAVNDSRVDPSDPVTWTIGPVYNGTTGNPVQNGISFFKSSKTCFPRSVKIPNFL